jgi:uncharacterized lipoprotein YmbA
MKVSRFACAASFALTLAGCAAPASQYYSLLPAAQSQARQVVPPAAEAMRFAISLQPVELPDQVNRPQIVLSEPDNTQVQVLNGSLWAAPLSNEIRNALADQLTSQLGVLDIPLGQAPRSLPVWRIDFAVQRFDSRYNRDVAVEATWRLEARNQSDKNIKICSAATQVDVGAGMSELVAGHQEALRRFAAVIAAQLRGEEPKEAGVQIKGCT